MAETSAEYNVKVIGEFRAKRGRVGGIWEGTPLLLLHHTGAKSGVSRVNPGAYLPDDGGYLIWAANGGAPNHPAWYQNLKTHPITRIEIGGETGMSRSTVQKAVGEIGAGVEVTGPGSSSGGGATEVDRCPARSAGRPGRLGRAREPGGSDVPAALDDQVDEGVGRRVAPSGLSDLACDRSRAVAPDGLQPAGAGRAFLGGAFGGVENEGAQHPDRDAQFCDLNAQVEAHLAAGEPVVSVDTKKKEVVGNLKNGGREWQPAKAPVRVDVHDLPDPESTANSVVTVVAPAASTKATKLSRS